MNSPMQKYEDFVRIILDYDSAEKLINKSNENLASFLSFPFLSFDKSIQYFSENTKKNFSVYKNYELVDLIIKQFNEDDQRLIYMYILRNMPAKLVSSYFKISERSMFRRYARIVDRFFEMYHRLEKEYDRY